MMIDKGKTNFISLFSLIASLFLLSLLILSCSDLGRIHSSNRISLDRSWELVTFIDSSGNELDMYDYEVHTLRFLNERKFAGEAACNQYGADYKASENGKITVSEFFVTEALCRQPSWGEEFVDAITNVKKYKKEDGRLILNYKKKGKLTFLERFE